MGEFLTAAFGGFFSIAPSVAETRIQDYRRFSRKTELRIGTDLTCVIKIDTRLPSTGSIDNVTIYGNWRHLIQPVEPAGTLLGSGSLLTATLSCKRSIYPFEPKQQMVITIRDPSVKGRHFQFEVLGSTLKFKEVEVMVTKEYIAIGPVLKMPWWKTKTELLSDKEWEQARLTGPYLGHPEDAKLIQPDDDDVEEEIIEEYGEGVGLNFQEVLAFPDNHVDIGHVISQPRCYFSAVL